MRKLLLVVGARPNFVKVARFREVAASTGRWQVVLVHTGQHRDERMSTVFLDRFGLVPDHWLGVERGTANARLARTILALEPVVVQEAPDRMLVVGDVDGTLAGALVADRLGIPLAHVESGLRSGDRSMPEEMNRILTDRIADTWFVTEASGSTNLLREGADATGIHLVGNTMIDTLVAFGPLIAESMVLDRFGLGPGGHVLLTLHRPSNVDDAAQLLHLVDLIAVMAARHRVVFPVHPRTAERLRSSNAWERLQALPGVLLTGPLDYIDFQKLLATAAVVITDSGGVQEETTWRGVPCLTLRPTTERPITVEEGTNAILPPDASALKDALDRIAHGQWKKGRIPDGWDGYATERIFEVLDRMT